MKKILLFLLVSTFGFSQTGVEVRLVEGSSYESFNESSLNTILQNFSVNSYEIKGGHLYEPYSFRTWQLHCSGCNMDNLVSALENSPLVENAKIADRYLFSDHLIIRFTNPSFLTSIETINGIAVTNDVTLNQIFTTYNVFGFGKMLPSEMNPPLSQYYYSVCNDCDITLLKTALDSYTAQINAVDITPAYYLLNTKEIDLSKLNVSPNPFTNVIAIDKQEVISKYSLFDSSGRQIIETNIKSKLDSSIQNLAVGIYILKLELNDSRTHVQKIIKK